MCKKVILSALCAVLVSLCAPSGTWTMAGGRPAGAHSVLLAATHDGTVYRTDTGTQWRRLWRCPDEDLGQAIIWSLAVVNGGQTIYASGYSGSLWRSTDGGNHWSKAENGLPGTDSRTPFDSFTVSPQNSNVVYGNGDPGLFKTIDGGDSWQHLTQGLPPTYVDALALDPQDPRSLWAISQASHSYYSGLFHSSDGGATWRPVSGNGLPKDSNLNDVAVSPVNSSALYVEGDDGFYESIDGGQHWINTESRFPSGHSDGPESAPIFDPFEPRHMYVLSTDLSTNVYESTDGGKTWLLRYVPGGTLPLADPATPSVAYAADDAGVHRTIDGGRTWQDWNGAALSASKQQVVLLAIAPAGR